MCMHAFTIVLCRAKKTKGGAASVSGDMEDSEDLQGSDSAAAEDSGDDDGARKRQRASNPSPGKGRGQGARASGLRAPAAGGVSKGGGGHRKTARS